MDFEPEEQQIVELLTRLKNQQDGAYPKKLLASRRQVFLGQMASIGAGLGIGAKLKTAAKSSKAGSVSHLSSFSVSSLVETLLVVAIVAQAGVIAYTYRDRIVDFVNSLSGITTPTADSIPVTGSSVPEVVVSDTPIVTVTPIETPTTTVTVISSNTTSSDITSNGDIQNTTVVETPQPANNNPGNHFGQTPKPTQEKNNTNPSSDSGGSGGGGGNGNGNGKKP